MTWDDTGFLISKNKYSENSLIVEFFTENHGKVPGIIFGGTSKKIKGYIQTGNKLSLNFNSKSENKIGYFKVELCEVLSPLYFNNLKKLSCIISTMNLIKILTAELQKNKSIYILIENFYALLDTENWIKNYIFWELELFKLLGYNLELEKLVEKVGNGNDLKYQSKSLTNKKIVPNFLIDRNKNSENIKTLLDGLKLVSDYLEKTILKPNNMSLPISRINFINSLK